ncbi:transposase family protein [Streptomyces sp. NPDC002922]|uniref:transposase family protein n=1 Tax=Streptomyces sp. NPDC002922 TaxID=3154439 RepID=UPI0033A49009
MSDTVVRVEARTTASRAACPGCRCWSDRIHGSYLRFPRDLPAVGKFVVVSLRVRRFVCAEKSSRVEHLLSRCRDSPAGSVGGPSGCDRRCSRSALPSQAQRSRKPDRYRPLMRQARICESRMPVGAQTQHGPPRAVRGLRAGKKVTRLCCGERSQVSRICGIDDDVGLASSTLPGLLPGAIRNS